VTQLAGSWVAGDSGRELQYYILQNGVALDVTDATNIVVSLVRQSAGSDVSVIVTGAVINPGTDGGFTWAGANAIGLFVPQPSARQSADIYEARVSFTLDGLVYWTDPFRIQVNRWGLSTIPTAAIGLDTSLDLQDVVDAFGGNGGRIELGGGGGVYYARVSDPTIPLTLPGGVEIVGAGRTTTILGSPVLVQGASSGLEDLFVRPDGAAYGIRFYNGGAFVSRGFLRRVLVGATTHGAGDGPINGIEMDGAGVFLGEHVTVGFCTGHGLLVDSTGAEPNTTLQFDCCSFVKNGLYGVKIMASCTLAEFRGGNMENNDSGEFYAESSSGIALMAVDFERGDTLDPPATVDRLVDITNCNNVAIERCNFLKIGNATRAFSIAGGGGMTVRGNRFDGWGTVGVCRIGETCTNVHVGVNHIQNGSGWIEDYSR